MPNCQLWDVAAIVELRVSKGIAATHHVDGFQGVYLSARIGPLVEVIGEYCCSCCPNLRTVSFECDSKLKELRCCAFAGSESPSTISIPSLAEVIGASHFSASVRFPISGLLPHQSHPTVLRLP
jgi:hypothetical protein